MQDSTTHHKQHLTKCTFFSLHSACVWLMDQFLLWYDSSWCDHLLAGDCSLVCPLILPLLTRFIHFASFAASTSSSSSSSFLAFSSCVRCFVVEFYLFFFGEHLKHFHVSGFMNSCLADFLLLNTSNGMAVSKMRNVNENDDDDDDDKQKSINEK